MKRIRITIELDLPNVTSPGQIRELAQGAATATDNLGYGSEVVYLATETIEEAFEQPLPRHTAAANKAWETRRRNAKPEAAS
jgi:phage baseplate assembly protein W